VIPKRILVEKRQEKKDDTDKTEHSLKKEKKKKKDMTEEESHALLLEKEKQISKKFDPSFIDFHFDQNFILQADVKIVCFYATLLGKSKLFQCWFHTRFVDRSSLSLKLGKMELDSACKDKQYKIFSPDFAVEFVFEECDHAQLDPSKK